MLVNCRLYDGQAQTCPAGCAIACFIGSIERSEYLLAIFRADTGTVVVDHNGDALVVCAERHGNMGVRITQGITHDIFQRAIQRTGVTVQGPRAGRGGDLQLFAHLFCFEAGVVQHVGPQFVGQQALTHQLTFLLPTRQHQ
ncbi:hypothetical protein D3C76_1219730 [compost metagenome]